MKWMLAVLAALVAEPAYAQIDGLLSPTVGVVKGGDVVDPSRTFALSVAALERTASGAEIDISHSASFLGSSPNDSSLTTLMANYMAGRPTGRVRPFGVVGVGLIRTRVETAAGARLVGRTDLGVDAGGGVDVGLTSWLAIRADVRYLRYVQSHQDLPRINGSPFDFWRTGIGVTYLWPIARR
ncbi:MAG: hypothetical protein U0Q12_18710 [Vicinamibacterales bacterium]